MNPLDHTITYTCRLLSNQLCRNASMKYNRFNNTFDTMINMETQFGKNHQQHATNSHSSEVMPCERPTLLNVTWLEDFNHLFRSEPC